MPHSPYRNFIAEELDRKDKKELMIAAVKEVNHVEMKSLFGKPKVGKTIRMISAILFSLFVAVLVFLLIFDIFPNPNIDIQYTLSFETYGGTAISSERYDGTRSIILPIEPTKDGYIFAGWYFDETLISRVTTSFLSSFEDHGDLTFYAKWIPNDLEVILRFNSTGGSVIEQKTILIDTDLSIYKPIKGSLFFAGWYLESDFQTLVTRVPYFDATLYAMWTPFELVTVGQTHITYSVPSGAYDRNFNNVVGGFQIATTETTYQLWYEVRLWAENHGYAFANLGREGNDGVNGDKPTDASLEPVTHMGYVDAMIWLNAFSQMNGLDPVYRGSNDEIMMDSTISDDQVMSIRQTDRNGYRLPSEDEWEMAARWTDDTAEGEYSIFSSGRYWTKGAYVSGALEQHIDSLVDHAWYSYNSQSKTHPVATKVANNLGLFDMNGNVSEWCYVDTLLYYNTIDKSRFNKGGSYLSDATQIRIYILNSINYDTPSETIGFRIALGRVNR